MNKFNILFNFQSSVEIYLNIYPIFQHSSQSDGENQQIQNQFVMRRLVQAK